MPNWNQVLNETKAAGSTHDVIRRQYLRQLHEKTNRNIIIYYSGWLQHPKQPGTEVNDEDKNGFMTTIHQLDRKKGLDLLLHTPGGDTSATESLVDYLRSMFGKDIRAIIPQLALSAGTMIACSCKEIVMGKQSSLGPIDPQFGGIPAHGVIEEFTTAHKEIKEDPSKMAVWQPIIANYRPTFIGECQKAITWADDLAKNWLLSNMFYGDDSGTEKVANILKELGDHALTLSHARHLSMEKCKEIGLRVAALEDDGELQDAVLSVHHACMHTLSATTGFKIIENHEGVAFIKMAQVIAVRQG